MHYLLFSLDTSLRAPACLRRPRAGAHAFPCCLWGWLQFKQRQYLKWTGELDHLVLGDRNR